MIYSSKNFLYEFKELISELKKNAYKSTINHKHSAALITSKQYILSIGFNHFITNDIHGNLKTVHAEINAICKLPKKLVKGNDILVIRVNKNNLKNSRPCNSCIDKLIKMGINKVYYSNEYGDIIYEYVNNMKKLHECSSNRYKIKVKVKLK